MLRFYLLHIIYKPSNISNVAIYFIIFNHRMPYHLYPIFFFTHSFNLIIFLIYLTHFINLMQIVIIIYQIFDLIL